MPAAATSTCLAELSEQVRLNVGGRLYLTTVETLRAVPASALALDFADNSWRQRRDADLHVFIDRDGEARTLCKLPALIALVVAGFIGYRLVTAMVGIRALLALLGQDKQLYVNKQLHVYAYRA